MAVNPVTAPTLTVEGGHWIVRAPGRRAVDFGVANVNFAGSVAQLPGKTVTGISPLGLISYADGTTTQLTLVPGKSAKQIAIDAGKVPANITDDAFIEFLKVKGDPSTVPGPTTYEREKALGTIPPTMTEAEYLASLRGQPGAPGKPGLIAAGTSLAKGVLHYYTGTVWTPAKPEAHELLLNATAIPDRVGDLIATGNLVDVTGLGFASGRNYYLTTPDSNGRNLTAIPIPATAPLLPTATASLCTVGQVVTQGSSLFLNFDTQVSIDPAAAAVYLNSFTQSNGALGSTFSKGPTYYATSAAAITVVSGVAKLALTTGGDSLAYINTGKVANGEIEGDLTQGGGLVCRYNTNGTGYMLLLQSGSSNQGYLYLVKFTPGSGDAVLWYRNTNVPNGRFRLTFKGTTLQVYEAGVLIKEVTDPDYSDGYVGIYSQPNPTAGVDNLKISPPPGYIV
jgi:hypothetical protein